MNKEILKLSIPNIISNITVPLMGIASTAIAGRIEGSSAAVTIGALSIGVAIFNFIYWNCSFIRMGTSGLTAQAFGAGDKKSISLMLWRALIVALGVGVVAFLLQYPIGEFSIEFMGTGDADSALFLELNSRRNHRIGKACDRHDGTGSAEFPQFFINA